jgi:hypothetical protein
MLAHGRPPPGFHRHEKARPPQKKSGSRFTMVILLQAPKKFQYFVVSEKLELNFFRV